MAGGSKSSISSEQTLASRPNLGFSGAREEEVAAGVRGATGAGTGAGVLKGTGEQEAAGVVRASCI